MLLTREAPRTTSRRSRGTVAAAVYAPMPSPEDKTPSDDELLDRLTYLLRRSAGGSTAAARDRARQILEKLASRPSPARLAQLLRESRGPSSRSGDAEMERWFLSGIGRLSPRDSEVLQVLLSSGAACARRPA